jgi:hypothetical protein
VFGNLGIERLFQRIAADRHALGTHRNSDLYGTIGNGIRDISGRFETRRAKSVQGAGASSIWESRREGGGAKFVGRFSIGNLWESN